MLDQTMDLTIGAINPNFYHAINEAKQQCIYECVLVIRL